MDNAQRVQREVTILSSSPAAGPQAQGARSLGSKKSFDALFAQPGVGVSMTSTSKPTPRLALGGLAHTPILPPIPSPPGLSYSSSSGSEYSSSEPDLPSVLAAQKATAAAFPPVRKDSSSSEVGVGGSPERHKGSSSSSSNRENTHSRHHQHRDHSTTTNHHQAERERSQTPSAEQLSSRTPSAHPGLRRSASTSTALKPSSSSASLSQAATSSRSKQKQRPREKKAYFPEGQKAGSSVPLSFSGEYDEDGAPIFVDECEPRQRSQSAPAILMQSKIEVAPTPGTPMIVLHDLVNEPSTHSEMGSVKKPSATRTKRTLTIFDTFSFPLPPTPGAARSPMPRSPGYHRATASESVIPSPLRQDMNAPPMPAASVGPKDLPTTRASAAQTQSGASATAPLRAASQKRHAGVRPLPIAPPLVSGGMKSTSSLSKGFLSPRSASAGGIGEFESFLSLSPIPPGMLQRLVESPAPEKGNNTGRSSDVALAAGSDFLAAPPHSARGKERGISAIIGMVDAAIEVAA